jgi:hypothetical protein
VAELGLEDDRDTDTLSRWMGHRIAELISRAETSSEGPNGPLHTEAAGAILDLWAHRDNWPRGWSAATINVQSLVPDGPAIPQQTVHISDRPTWLDGLLALEQLQKQQLAAWRDRAFLEFPAEEAEEWLNRHAERLNEEERSALRHLADHARLIRRDAEAQYSVTGKSPAVQTPDAAQVLEARIDEIAEATKQLRESIVTGWPRSRRGRQRSQSELD